MDRRATEGGPVPLTPEQQGALLAGIHEITQRNSDHVYPFRDNSSVVERYMDGAIRITLYPEGKVDLEPEMEDRVDA
jgi:hypothetical protein